jgi:hypothetical protein
LDHDCLLALQRYRSTTPQQFDSSRCKTPPSEADEDTFEPFPSSEMMALSRASSASTVYGYKHLAFCLIGGQHPSMDARFYAELGETMILAMFWLIHHPRSSFASASPGASATELQINVCISLFKKLISCTIFPCSALAHLLNFLCDISMCMSHICQINDPPWRGYNRFVEFDNSSLTLHF